MDFKNQSGVGMDCPLLEIGMEAALDIRATLDAFDVSVLGFPNLKTLGAGAASVLAECFEDFEFEGLESLSADTARELAKHRGGYMSFPAIQHLDAAVAEAFRSHKQGLMFNGVKTLTVEAAEGLSRHRGKLGLEGLEVMSAAVAEKLADHRGNLLQIGVRELDDEAADAIAQYPGDLLLLNLQQLSDRSVAAFGGRSSGNLLALCGVRAIYDRWVPVLANHPGLVVFEGLEFVSPAALADLNKLEKVILPHHMRAETPESSTEFTVDVDEPF